MKKSFSSLDVFEPTISLQIHSRRRRDSLLRTGDDLFLSLQRYEIQLGSLINKRMKQLRCSVDDIHIFTFIDIGSDFLNFLI